MAMIDPSVVWDFAAEVVGAARRDRGRTRATVTRIDADGTTWVTTGDGGEAPAGSVAAGVSVGDTVTLDWDGSSMGISSNVSNPAPSGSTIRRAVDRARSVASAAQRVADAVNQHFFADTNGIHVTEATQEEWDESHTGANVLLNSLGQLFRDGLNNLLTLTTESGARALTIWDGLGNSASNILARFSSDGISFADGTSFDIGDSSSYIHFDGNGHINIGGSGLTIGGYATNADVADAIDGISVGGRNLLTGSGDWSGGVISSGAGTVSGDVFSFTTHDTLGWYSIAISYPHIPFPSVDGKTLTLGFDYRSNDFSDTTGDHYIYINAAASATIDGGRSKYRQISTSAFDGVYVPTTEWQRGSITFDLSESLLTSGSGACNYFFIQFYNHTLNSLQLRHVKLEVGNIATDWTPAPEDIEAYADESAYLSAKPNIAPLGSVELSDVYNATTNPNGYWRATMGAWYTRLDDGWIHVYVDNSAGTGAVNSTSFRPSPSPSVFAGKVYTILTEVRNNVSTGTGTNDFYLQQINNNQFWGNTSGVVIDDNHVTTTTTVSLLTCGQSYVLRSYRIADTSHLTAGTPSPEMFRYNFRAAAGSILDFDFRMSVYEGIYDGPYKPYAGTQLFATQTDASNAAKTATSYVTEITGQNGIMVHPSTDQTTGVQITSDVDILRDGYSVMNVGTQGDTSGNTDAGVTIYDGTTSQNVVAKFDSDEVSLGANSDSSTIDMCGGMWNVSVDTSDPVIPVATIKANGSASAAQNVTPTLRMVSHADYGTYSVEYGVEVQTNDGIQYPVSIVHNGDRVIGFGTLGMQTPGLTLTNSTGSTVRAPYGIHMITATGTNSWSTAPGTVLWSGAYHMTASHTASLTYNVSTCHTGIVLHWQAYVNGSAANQDQCYCFVPKSHVANFAGGGVQMPLMTSGFGNVGCKYVYVYDNRVVGAANNNQSGTASGITYNNAYWVLTQIIAV